MGSVIQLKNKVNNAYLDLKNSVDDKIILVEEKIKNKLIRVYINGYGFPIWRGGPMHHANAMGLDKVIEKLEKYREITGNDVYKPSEMLVNLAKDGGKLGEAPQKGDRKEKLGFEMSSVANNF